MQRRIYTWQYKERGELAYCVGLRSALVFVFAMVSHDPQQLMSVPFSCLPGSLREIRSLRRSSRRSDAAHPERHEPDNHSVTRSDPTPSLPPKLRGHWVQRAKPRASGRLLPRTERAASPEWERPASRHRERARVRGRREGLRSKPDLWAWSALGWWPWALEPGL